jgi:creatinine amidohydrolase
MMHGFIPPSRYFAYLSWERIAALPDKANTVLLQPVAAIEQHGPHLPVVVDSAIVMGVLGNALAKLDPAVPCYVLPPLYYGKSNEHVHFPGTITLSAATLMATLGEVADSVYRAGFRKLAFVNAHGGQPQVCDIAARDARVRHGDLSVFPTFIWSVPHCGAELVPVRESMFGIHAGALETALLLALLPDTVDMSRALAEYPHGVPEEGLVSMEGERPGTQGFAWLTNDLTRSGVIGDATLADAAMGRRLLDSLGDGWARLIGDLVRFRQPRLSPGPLAGS